MRNFAFALTLAGALCASAIAVPADSVEARDDRHEVKFSFPTTLTGVDFGQQDLIDAIKKDLLSAERVVERAFDGMPLLFMVDMVSRLPSTEAQAVNLEIKDADVVTIAASSGTAFEKGKRLDDAKVSERDLVRALSKVVKEFEPNEAAAMVVQMGYSEAWLLRRINQTDTSKDAFKKIEDACRRDLDRPTRLWKDQTGSDALSASLELWLEMQSTPSKAKLLKVFEKDDKKLTPEIWRIVQFGDATLAAAALEAAGISKRTFDDMVEDELRIAEKADIGAAQSKEIVRVLMAKAYLPVNWISAGRNDVAGVYQSSLVRGEGLLLDSFVDGTWKKLADYGISDSLLSATQISMGWKLVLLKDGAARLVIGHRRYEGKLDAATKTLSLTSRSGFGDEVLKKLEVLGDGMLIKAERARGNKDAVNLLLKRIPAFRS